MKNIKEVKEQVKKLPSQKKEISLEGKIFVFTGELENYTRAKATALVELLGGKVSSTVNSKVNFVVVGEDAGSKLAKAKALNIKTLTEAEFLKIVGR